MKPPKIARTLFYGFIIESVFCFMVVAAAPKIPSTPRCSYDYLVAFENCISRFQSTDPSNVVIVGASYAVLDGESEGITNFGFTSAYPADVRRIVREHCADRTVVYPITMRDILLLDYPSREWVHNPILRHLVIGHLFFKEQLGLTETHGTSGSPLDGVSASDRAVLAESLGLSTTDNSFTRSWYYIYRVGLDLSEPIDLSSFIKLKQECPGMVFLIQPTPPMRTVSTASQFAQDVNRFAETREHLPQILRDAGLPVIVPSCRPTIDDFRDCWHFRLDRQEHFASLIRNEILYDTVHLKLSAAPVLLDRLVATL